MPIVRSYMCAECGLHITMTLEASQWDDDPPDCPHCSAAEMQQEFKPVAIGLGQSARSKAEKITEDILGNDYNVGNIQRDHHEGSTPKTVYKDQGRPFDGGGSQWSANRETLEAAIAVGRQTRLQHGSGLDILQQSLKSGAQPDLIEVSKRRAIKVW